MFKYEVCGGFHGTLTNMIICEPVGHVWALNHQRAYAKAENRFSGYDGLIVRPMPIFGRKEKTHD